MNKIFRVVWSQATQSWVVVSELTKTHKKQSSSNAQKSAVNFSGNFIKSSAIALALLSGHSAYAVETAANGLIQINSTKGTATATGSDSIAIGKDSKAMGNNNSLAIGYRAQATGNDGALAIGGDSKASGKSNIALGYQAQADKDFAVAIGRGASAQQYNNAVAIGANAQANGATSLALGMKSKATGHDSYAIGYGSDAIGEQSIAFGRTSKASNKYDIVLGSEANTRDEGQGHSIAIGLGAMSGTHSAGKNFNGGDAGGVAIGTGAYTGVNRNNISLNSAVAVGAGAGAGYRNVDADGLPIGVATDADKNNEVLVKAFGGTTGNLGYFKNAGNANKDGFFSFQNVNINEATALGRNARAIGDQSVAIGAQSVAGQGSIVIGGNDIQAYDGKKYFKAANPDSKDAKGVNDFDAETTPGTGKNGQPIRIKDKYKELVGAALDNSYRSSYGQDGSTVIGMQAHSTTPLGVAIGTNSIVRKGAFGATAIGSGASVLANAEAAVAIGMGSEAQGNYAVAAGTAARAKESAVAAGYQANADKSAVAVGDSSNATTSSVAVGQLAKAEKVADIAVGQGAVASGEQGAIAMGLGTRAQGDSSIMIGGSEITKVAAQTVNYQKEKKDGKGHAVIKTTKKKEQINGEEVERTIRSVEMEAATGTIQDAYGELTNGATLNTATLDYSLATNKNGHGSISMGIHSLSTGDLGTAIGTGARVAKLGGVALGTGAISELQNGVAIGTGSRADANSIGTRQTDISYDEEGRVVPFDSKKVAYTFYWAGGTNTSEGDVVSFGTPGAERQLKNVAAGRIADDSTDAINCSQLNSVTKRMSSGWSVEGEKDHGSSGVLKLKGTEATGKSVNYAADGKSFTNGEVGTATGKVDKVRLNDEVKIRVGDNLVLNQEDASRPVYEDPDDKTRQTGTRITSKFTYSLNPVLTGLTSATFKNDAGDTTVINGTGVTVTPVTTGKQAVSLTTDGLNNGGNAISNVAGNLPDTKNNDAATGPSNATKSQDAPTLGNTANQVNPTNAATVGDVLNAGWNIQGDGTAVDFVKPYDTVNFVKGDGTSVTVESADGKTSTVKYSVNLGDGLEKDANNKIAVKAADKSLAVDTNGVKVNPGDKSLKTTDAGLTVNTADKSLEVTNDGLKAKTDGTTITTGDNGLKVVTGGIESVTTGANPGTVKVKDGDTGKIATVDSVVNAVNSAAWTATSAKTIAGELGAEAKDQAVKAGDKVTFEADKNIKITQAGSKFTFATRDDVSFNTVQIGGDQGPKLSKTADGNISVSDKDGTEPVKITNVKDGAITADSKDAINGSQFHKLANNTIQLKGQNGTDAATETKKQELNKEGGIAFTVKSSDGTLLDVTAKGDTITLTPKTGTITTGADGIPTANTTGGKLVTAEDLVTALKEMGWKATSGKDGSGTATGTAEALVKAGETVTFKAGDNLAVKQSGKEFIYSLNPALTGLTSAEFKDGNNNKVNITPEGITITKPADPTAGTPENTVTLNQNGLNNGGNPITNVTSNLVNYNDPDVSGKAPVRNGLRNFDNNGVPDTNVATVGDIRNMGWIVSSDKSTGENGAVTTDAYSATVKNANEVKFVGEGSAIVSGKTDDNGVRTITVGVDVQKGINQTVTPVNYTKADGTKVYPKEVDNGDGTKSVKFYPNPDGSGAEIPSSEVITSVNGPKGTTNPTTLSNVEGNLDGAKTNTTAPTTSATAPTVGTGTGEVNKNNAATVGDVLNAGWNLQGNGTAVDFVKAYDTVNFINGDGTTATVASADGKTSTVKYSVNLGKGLQKDDKGNTISVKPADNSLVVDNAGVKVNTGTINNVTTGDKAGTVEANTGDRNKIATVGNVVDAINSAAWTATSAKTTAGELGAEAKDQAVKAGDKVTFEADKNIKITQNGSKFTFTTKDNVSFSTVQVGGDQGLKLSKTDDGDLKVSGPNGTDPVKVTNVKAGEISNTSTDAINGSQFHAVAKNKIKLAGQNGTAAATETDEQELDKTGGIKFTVKSSDGTLLDVTASGDTITLTPKTGTITTGTDGVPTADVSNGKLVTAEELVTALKGMGWKATAGQDGTGTVDGNTEELIKAGETVTFKAGNNLAVKQAGKDFIYSLKTELTGLTSAEFKDANNNVVNITPTGVSFKKLNATDANTVTLNQNGLNNGGNLISNVTSGLANHTEVGKHELRNLTNTAVLDTTAATVGDLRNMGWVVSSNKTTGDLGNPYSEAVKNTDEVKFVGTGLATVSGKTENGVRTITVDVESKPAINAVTYTKTDGTKVYPVEGPTGTTYHTTPEGKGPNDETVDGNDVITSVNGAKGTQTPSTLSNVKSNFPDTKNNDATTGPSNATTAQAAPNTRNKSGNDYVNPNNAATVGDVLNAGWNLQGNGTGVDFVKAYDTVNFIDGDGTTATVASADGKTSTVKYSVNLGKGLQKDGTGNTISVKPADNSLVVDDAGVKVNTGTINNVTTGDKTGTVEAKTGDENKIATVGNVVNAINSAAWTATSAKTNDGELGKEATNQLVKAGDKVTFEADKNIKITQNGSKFTFTTKDNVSFSTVQVGGDQGPKLSKTDDGDLKVSGPNGTAPVKVTNVKSGLDTYDDNVPGTTDKNRGLVDLSKPANGDAPKVSDNTAATVGDLRNMGWIVSADKKTGDLTNTYSDTVKNANEVKFVGEGTAIVSGKTEGNVRTITVKVNDQVSTNNSVTAVNYTKADGTKVYPKMVTNPDTGKEELKFFEKPDGSGAEVPKGDVVTSINGPEGTTSPTTLKNVKNNIPSINDGTEDITKPDGTVVGKTPDNGNINKAPLTAEEAAKLSNPKTADGAANPKYIGNNAATVSDVLNAGWNLQNNGTAKDFVKPYDTVNFINGLGTTAVVTTRDGNTASDVTFNVKAANGSVTVDEDGVKVTTGEMKPAVDANQKETGAIATPVDPAKAKELKDNLDAAVKELATAKEMLKAAETALAVNPNNATLKQLVEAKKADVAAKQAPVDTAQKAHDKAGLNKVATVQNVAEAINNSGFNLKTSADGGEKLTTGTKNDGELIKPSNTVEMVAGNNLTVKQDENGKITYATKDNVAFTNVATDTLNVGSHTYTDGKGNTYTKVGENYYNSADVVNGTPKPGAPTVDVTTTPVTPVSPVTMKTEAAKSATNNAADAQPSSALNVTSKDGKPTQITGVGSTLNTETVDTTPEGTVPGTTPNTTPENLVDLKGTDAAPVNKNAAATVGDLQNMGWVVSAKDGNGYKDVVKNANVVDFKGSNGIEVTGKTLPDGTREITVGIKEGEVTNKVTITHADGSKTEALKIGDNYYKVDDNGKPVGFEKGPDGKPAGTPLNVDPKTDTVTNAGAGVVTGNAVANAIQDSGWNVGIGSTDKEFSKDAKVYDKVNPNDDVKFANGANTNVSMVTVDALNEDGTKKATTFVKFDINRDLKIDSVTTGGTATDKNGNNLVKVGDQYFKEGDVTVVTNPDGTTTVTPKENAKPVPPTDVIPPKDGAMIVKNADGKDVVSATVGKDGNGAFGINGKDGKNGISMTAKDGQGTIGVNGKDGKSTTIVGDTITIKDKDNNATNIGVNTITLIDKAGNTTTTTADKSEIKDAAGNINVNTATGNTLKDPNGNTHISTASTSELKDKAGNTNTSTPTTNVLKDTNGNTNTSAATGTTYTDKDENKTVVGPKEIALSDKDGNNTSKLTNNDLVLNTKDPKTGVEKTSHMSGDKISFNTTDEIEKDANNNPVIDPKTNQPKIKNPGNSTEYTNEGVKVIPNSTVARDANGNPTFLDKDGKPVMKDTDGNYKYMGQDGKPGANYTQPVGALKPNVSDNTRVISFGMDKPVLDKNGNPVKGPDGKPVMTEGISAGMQQIHNVAPGRISPTSTDAVNGSQLYAVASNIGNLNNKINKVGKHADAGTASALAAANIPQAYTPGKSLVGIAAGSYQGQTGVAVGMSRISDNGKIIIRLSGTTNTQGRSGVAAGVGSMVIS